MLLGSQRRSKKKVDALIQLFDTPKPGSASDVRQLPAVESAPTDVVPAAMQNDAHLPDLASTPNFRTNVPPGSASGSSDVLQQIENQLPAEDKAIDVWTTAVFRAVAVAVGCKEGERDWGAVMNNMILKSQTISKGLIRSQSLNMPKLSSSRRHQGGHETHSSRGTQGPNP